MTVELDGVLADENGNARANQTVSTSAIVSYSDGATATTNLAIRTSEGGVFGLSVPVDGSDGLSHNVTAVNVPALGQDSVAVTMAPYALKAASVEVIASPDYIVLDGENISIGNVAARSIAAAESFDARSSDSFTAGSLKGFKDINIEKVSVSGGSLKWLGGMGPASGVAFANLGEMSVGGGVPAVLENTQSQVESKLSVTKGNTLYRVWKAANDGFFQLQAQALKPQDGEVRLYLFCQDAANPVVVTEMGRASDSDDLRRLVWTVPVRAGDRVELATGPASGSAVFELTSVRAQFIYFGVAE